MSYGAANSSAPRRFLSGAIVRSLAANTASTRSKKIWRLLKRRPGFLKKKSHAQCIGKRGSGTTEDDMAKKSDDVLDLTSLLHPAAAFDHPRDVANDPDLSLNEKRAILASWASDACSVEGRPTDYRNLISKASISFECIVEVLRKLDRSARVAQMPTRHYRQVLAKLRGKSTSGSRDEGGRGGSPLQ
jgi:hypothetical protein